MTRAVHHSTARGDGQHHPDRMIRALSGREAGQLQSIRPSVCL
jgi:hypothetical protein